MANVPSPASVRTPSAERPEQRGTFPRPSPSAWGPRARQVLPPQYLSFHGPPRKWF